MTTKKYHTLLERGYDKRWAIVFGDYDRSVVEDERTDCMAATDQPSKSYCIITTSDDQADIQSQVDALNFTEFGRAVEARHGARGYHAFEATCMTQAEYAGMSNEKAWLRVEHAMQDMGAV